MDRGVGLTLIVCWWVFGTPHFAVKAAGSDSGTEMTPPAYTAFELEAVRRVISSGFGGATWTDAADLDGDGACDLVASAWDNAEVAWWENDGTGERWTKRSVETGFINAVAVAAADLDGDGATDIVGATKLTGRVVWWRNDRGDGTAWTKYDIGADVPGVFSLTTADLNGDGALDVLSQSTKDPARAVVFWLNGGDGRSWTETVVEDGTPGIWFTRAADIDGDGDPDIVAVVFRRENRAVLWYENPGAGSGPWRKVNVSVEGAMTCFFVSAGDIDGDGDCDLVATRTSKPAGIVWFENETPGEPGWPVHEVDSDFEAPYTAVCADLDGDGDTDVAGVSNTWGTVAWWENADGRGKTWVRHILDTAFPLARNVVPADVDGDGAVDLVGTAFGAAEVGWWRLKPPER